MESKIEKIKKDPTIVEMYEFLLKCAKHEEAGGKVTYKGTNLGGFYSVDEIYGLEIHHTL